MFDLMELEADFVEREIVRGALAIGSKALEFLGFSETQAVDLSERFLEYDFKMIEGTWSDKDILKILIYKAKATRELMKQTLNSK